MEFNITNTKEETFTVIIDKQNWERVKNKNWHIIKRGRCNYVGSNRLKSDNQNLPKCILLHAFIMGVYGKEIDHKNRNSLDNRESNLRLVSHKENCRNTSIPINNKSGFKGVHFRKDAGLYRVKIEVDKVQIYGGYYKYAINAAKKYNKLAVRHFGEYANLNIIPENDNTPFELDEPERIRKYIGVEPYNNKFRVRMYINDIKVNVGIFDKEIEAAKAWNDAVIQYNKPNRFLNKDII